MLYFPLVILSQTNITSKSRASAISIIPSREWPNSSESEEMLQTNENWEDVIRVIQKQKKN